MATLLNDNEIRKLLGTVIVSGEEDCIRPNSYVIRLGDCGEFINTKKEFILGKPKKGIKVQSGHSVALTAYEIIDFRRETVHKIFPDCDLHGIVSPTTDLSREGLVAPTTIVDSGYHGTLNWTITNTSSDVRQFVFKEKIFRLTIQKLEKGERPEKIYDGDYQNQIGYVPSMRKGPPVSIKESEWEDSMIEGGPEALLENLIKSGYPWHLLGSKLKMIDLQLKAVTEEYAEIHTSIDGIKNQISDINRSSNNIPEQIRIMLKEDENSLQNRWVIITASIIFALIGLGLAVTGSDWATQFVKKNAALLGLILIVVASVTLFIMFKKKN